MLAENKEIEAELLEMVKGKVAEKTQTYFTENKKLKEHYEARIETLIDENMKQIKESERKIKEAEDRIKEAQESARATIESFKLDENERFNGKVNDYVEIVVGKYINENSDRFKELETFGRICEAFNSIKNAFEENGFVVQNKGIEKLTESVKTHKENFELVLSELKQAQKELEEAKRTIIFENKTRDLSYIQREKVTELLQSMEFEDLEGFEKGLNIVVEQYNSKPGKTALFEEKAKPSYNDFVTKVLKTLR